MHEAEAEAHKAEELAQKVGDAASAFEGDAKIHFHNGNWSSYEEERRKRFGDAAAQPHRLKYRKLTRT